MLNKKRLDSQQNLSALRSLAEERLKLKQKSITDLCSSPEEMLQMFFELEVHQIELEVQRDELLQSRMQLEESLERYSKLYDFAPLGYLTLAGDSKILEANLTAAKMLGIDRSLLQGTALTAFIIAEDLPVVNAMIDDVFNNRTRGYCEVILLGDATDRSQNKNASSPYTVGLDAVLSEDAEECRVIVSDISARKKTEQLLLESVERHHSLFDNMLNGIAYCHMIFEEGRPVDFMYEQVNSCFEKLTGLKQVEGKKVSELIPGIHTINPKFLEAYGRVATTGKAERFEIFLEPLKMWLDISAYSVKKDHFVAVFDNITERKLAENRLKKLSVAVEQSPADVIITDPLGNIEYVNPIFSVHTGYSAEEVKGQNLRIIKSGLMPPSVYEELWKTILKGYIWCGELQNKKKNGDLYWERAVISGILNKEGVITSFVAVKVDVTEQKKILGQLIVAKEKAEESDRLKSAFLANMSHEIRTPMNGIIGFAELLKEPLLSTEEESGYIDMIQESGQRMLSLINDLIDISRIEAGETLPQISETPVNKILHDIHAFFKPEAEQNGLYLTYAKGLSDNESIIETDCLKLHQILTNLCKNALKFTSKGGIDFGYTRKENMLEFYVTDSGIGIPVDMEEKVFDRFSQVDNSLTRNHEGAGLGLSISKAYVQMMGGTIRVESVEVSGSKFIFTLPYNPPAAHIIEMPALVEEESLLSVPSVTLLIAEDDKVSAMLLIKSLKRENMTILTAGNGQQAVELVRSHPEINLVLMDIRMPVMNGFDATKQIKLFRPDLFIIVQTAFTSKEDSLKAREAGCDGFITKPVNKTELLELIHSLLHE
ncbi:MAG: ATP-binding protein [Chlorobiales bacterium]|nr:ATP-binding protein [Chlorobiales bacterium]